MSLRGRFAVLPDEAISGLKLLVKSLENRRLLRKERSQRHQLCDFLYSNVSNSHQLFLLKLQLNLFVFLEFLHAVDLDIAEQVFLMSMDAIALDQLQHGKKCNHNFQT